MVEYSRYMFIFPSDDIKIAPWCRITVEFTQRTSMKCYPGIAYHLNHDTCVIWICDPRINKKSIRWYIDDTKTNILNSMQEYLSHNYKPITWSYEVKLKDGRIFGDSTQRTSIDPWKFYDNSEYIKHRDRLWNIEAYKKDDLIYELLLDEIDIDVDEPPIRNFEDIKILKRKSEKFHTVYVINRKLSVEEENKILTICRNRSKKNIICPDRSQGLIDMITV